MLGIGQARHDVIGTQRGLEPRRVEQDHAVHLQHHRPRAGAQAFLQRLDLAHGAEEQRAKEFGGRDAGRRLAGGQGFDADRVLVR